MPKRSNPGSGAAVAATKASESFDDLLKPGATPEQFCAGLAKLFEVHLSEVALYRLEKSFLRFLYPLELRTVGAIPLSSSAVSAHTAYTRRADLFNKFMKVKHASVFEQIKLGNSGEGDGPATSFIQKLMSAPVRDEQGEVLGVVQVCRKGKDPSSCGPDFSLQDLHRLEQVGRVLAKAAFMQSS